MTYRPDHRTQLQKPRTGPFDCGPRSWQHGIDFQTHGRKAPGIDQLRRQGGRPGAQPTNVYDADRAFDAQRLRYARIVGGDWSDAVGALRAGKGLQICVSYGVVTDLQPRRSGSESFRGGHSIYIQELRRTRHTRRLVVLSFDSLFDGRRPGIPSDKAHWVRLGTYRRATQAFAGRAGLWWGGIIAPYRGDIGGPGLPGWEEPDIPDIDDVAPIDPDDDPVEGEPLPPGSSGEDLDDRDPDDEEEDDADDDALDLIDDDEAEGD